MTLTDNERRRVLMAHRDGVLKPGEAVLIEVSRIVAEREARALRGAADHFDQFDVVTVGPTDIGSNLIPVDPAERLRNMADEREQSSPW